VKIHVRRRSAVLAASALLCAIGVSACGGFDSAASGEHLIRDYVNKFGQGKVKVKSVSCPGGVKQQAGHTYTCKVVLHDVATNTDHAGTITVHIESGNKVQINGSQDLSFQ